MTARSVVVDDGMEDAELAARLAGPAAALAAGELVAFPTETVYGLGADALSPAAVQRIFTAKDRPADNPLIVHLPDPSWLDRVAIVTPLARALADRYWPGPLTLVMTTAPGMPAVTTAGLTTVAVRIPDSRIARFLIDMAGTPVAAPSANRSGRPSPTTADHVLTDLGDGIPWIIDGGASRIGIESTVVDATGPAPIVLRDGAITREMLGGDLGSDDGVPGRSPGTRHRHYQPRARVVVAPTGAATRAAHAHLADGAAVGIVAAVVSGVDPAVTVLAQPADGEALARVLYGAFRHADLLGLDTVVVEAVAGDGMGRAVMDRLHRAQADDDPA